MRLYLFGFDCYTACYSCEGAARWIEYLSPYHNIHYTQGFRCPYCGPICQEIDGYYYRRY